MSNFVNMNAGNVTINNYQDPLAAVTTLEDMLANATDSDCLTASINNDDIATLCGDTWAQTTATDFVASLSFEKLDYNTNLKFAVEFDADAVAAADDLSNLDWDTAIESAVITVQ